MILLRLTRLAEWVLLVIGFSLAGWYFFTLANTRVYQSYENYKLDEKLSGRNDSLLGYLGYLAGRKKTEPEAAIPVPRQKVARPIQGQVIGRIEIPRVQVSAVVREGVDDKTLKQAAGHVPSTSLPGENGNVGIAAHRDSFFRNLRGIKNGDLIRMVTPGGIFQYEVSELKIVRPENVEVLKPTPEPSLTLVTCYPFNYVGSAPKRFIVRARQRDLTDSSGTH